jgi:hypothetical protein
MDEVVISEDYVTVDQALIWICTRRTDLVDEARHTAPATRRLTWVWIQSSDEEEVTFIVPPKDAECTLLYVFRKGWLSAWQDGVHVEPAWFHRAKLKNVSLAPPNLKNIVSGPSSSYGVRMIVERRRDEPVVVAEHEDGRQAIQAWERAALRVPATDLVQLFPKSGQPIAVTVAGRSSISSAKAPMTLLVDSAAEVEGVFEDTFVRQRSISEADLKRGYEAYLRENSSTSPPPDRDTDVERLRRMFPDNFVATKPVYAVRRDMAPQHWKDGGRRPKTIETGP